MKNLITFEKDPVVYIHSGHINMSYSFNGLMDVIQKTIKRKPSENEVFVFFNKARSKMKMIFYHNNGFVIVYKSLDDEVFELEYKNGMKRVKNINVQKLLDDIKTDEVISRKKGGA